ncbi:nucleolar complex protein 14 [Thecamonas trahens ATCC 50062]|uniref:Nucleolar complex protein 14 n=1 Tax=Thecamonas trahens ATCC 50062 TaxID=461836 RepID=A0A0L0DCX6_THETB|nr:nucleolar complex protein 14 [Thecamonas trahens ATCC 50062]KNC49966.1 nucleolar complex protein 14 [Thecamonas trahens ATCC 50062]|eukprot:XP_013757137.1 nucleolar complex protein 14 [Thecamonas trahens ATCC 50062]
MGKTSGPTSKVAAKRARRAAAAAAAKKASTAFETRSVKTKFDVVGQRRVPGATTQNIAISRTRGLEKRKETLGVELAQKDKRNAFIDRRFGEDDPSLSKDDKLLMRYQKERQARSNRSQAYNLNNDDGDDGDAYLDDEFARRLAGELPVADDDVDVLTHGGRTLASTLLGEDVELTLENVQKFKDSKDAAKHAFELVMGLDGFGDDDDDDSFGGLRKTAESSYDAYEKRQQAIQRAVEAKAQAEAENPSASKSKREIYAELIAKSKLFKNEAAQLKALQDEVTEKLDAQFDAEISDLLADSKRKILTRDEKRTLKRAMGHDEYDSLLSDLAKDERIQASDKLKTPEELARIERDRLRKLEAERVARMTLGGGSDDEGAASNAYGLEPVFEAGDDDASVAGMEVETVSAAELASMTPAERRAVVRKQRKELRKEKARLRMGDDKYQEQLDKLAEAQAKRAAARRAVTGDDKLDIRREGPGTGSGLVHKSDPADEPDDASMPFVFDMPDDEAGLAKMLAPYTPRDMGIIIRRLRKLNAVELGANAREAQQKLFTLLLVHAAAVGSSPSACTPKGMAVLDVLAGAVHDMASDLGHHAVTTATELIASLQSSLVARPDAVAEPGTLLLIKLLARVFPVSDARHCVTTPLALLMAEMLTQVAATTAPHVAAGLFLAAEAFTFVEPAARFMPEPLLFLHAVIAAVSTSPGAALPSRTPPPLAVLPALLAVPADASLADKPEPLDIFALLRGETEWLAKKKAKKGKTGKKGKAKAKAEAGTTADSLKVSMASAAVAILSKYAVLYTSYEAYESLFRPFVAPLEALAGRMPALSPAITPLVEHIRIVCEGMEKSRRPLTLLARKAASISMYTPLFEEEYMPTKDYDPDKVRSELRKMKRKIKDERKGAMRELRKDNAYLAAEASRKRARDDAEYQTKIKGIYASLESEQAEANKLARMQETERKKKKRKFR